MKKLLAIILSITTLLSMGTVAFADGVDGPMQKAKLKVGISADFPPFEYYDENEELYGFDVDLMNYIGDIIGFDIEFVNMSFDQLFSAVMGGDVDCAISAIAITEERKNVIDYTIPYLSAKVTYWDEESTDTSIEEYAIVFPNNSVGKANVLEAAGQVAIYNLVNNALSELIEDKTVEKLGEKYNLNKSADTDEFDYEYTVMPVPTELPNGENDTSDISTGGQTSATSVPYSDWAKSDIEKAIALNIINVGGNYNFPAPITREEFCELIYNYCYNVIKEVDTITGENKFTDTTNSKIIRLNAMGIINGKSETEFAPNDLLTREEAAAILNRMVNKTIPVPVTEMYFNFDDEANISDWASDSIQVMCNMGVMNGVGENKFAPQDTYTTEQAIVTIVRVYAAQSANTGIVGGADGPTSIIVGENPTVIGGADKPTKIVVTDTIKVDDFYVDEAIKLITESGKLASDKDFISVYTTNDEMTEKVLSLGAVDFNKPKDIYYLSADREQIIANIETLAKAEGVDFSEMGDVWVEHILKKFNFSTLASLINSSYGAENLAALTILTNSRGYIMPKDFKNNFALFVQYEGDYSAIVSFSKFGDGVISANMSFVKNGDKDNVFMRMYEITSTVGEDGVKMAKVEK